MVLEHVVWKHRSLVKKETESPVLKLKGAVDIAINISALDNGKCKTIVDRMIFETKSKVGLIVLEKSSTKQIQFVLLT